MMRVADLFAGIGGFSLGLERTGGFETAVFVEQDDFCRRELAKHWPTIPCHDDVRTFDATDHGRIDVVTGGFPCQPYSHAGQRRGTKDDRYLWPALLAVIESVRPSWCVLENVAGLGSMVLERGPSRVESRSGGRHANGVDYVSVFVRQERMLLGAICDDLCALGYAVTPPFVPACAVDAPHRRDRVWIVGHAERSGRRADEPRRRSEGRAPSGRSSETMADTDGSRHSRSEKSGLHRTAQGDREADHVGNGNCAPVHAEAPWMPGDVADAAGSECGRRRGHEPAQPGRQRRRRSGDGRDVSDPRRRSGEGTGPSIGGCETPARWLPEPPVGRMANGIPSRVHRLRALGNAVVPAVVEQIGRAILAAEQRP